jgi:hypothetical protein
MTWGNLISGIEYSIAIWFVGVFVAVGWQAIRGEMLLSGLVVHTPGARLSFHRLQNLAVTLVFAAGYLIASLNQVPGDGLPDVPAVLLMPVMGSQGVYLLGKYLRGPRDGRGG